MAKTFTPVTTHNLANQSSITAAIDANFAALVVLLLDVLSLEGDTPNQLKATLDVNSQQIINLPAPATLNAPVRLRDVVNNPTIQVPPVGTSGATVPLLNGNNTWSGTNDFLTSPPGTNNTRVATTAFVQAYGMTNINTLSDAPFVTDGVTSNIPRFQSLVNSLLNVNPEMPIPVNISVGTPTVLSLNPTAASGGSLPNPAIHFLKPNQAFYFTLSGGGSLPSGISLGTVYYITAANLAQKTFTFSTTNNYGLLSSGLAFTSEGSTVNTTGSLTGTLSIVLTGRNVNIFIPPGPYYGGNFGDAGVNVPVTPNGISNIRYFAYGATFDTKTSFGCQAAGLSCMVDPATWALTQYDLVNTTPNDKTTVNVDALVTLQTTADATKYYVGQWITMFGLNVQDAFGHAVSGPPNLQYQEFKRIKAINTGTGVLTLDGPLKWCYLSTFPQLFTPTSVFVAGGAASISPMHPAWDTEIEIRGARWVGQPPVTAARRVLFEDCIFQGFANNAAQAAPTLAQSFIYRNCTFGPGDIPGATYMEVDKMLEYLKLEDCRIPSGYRIQFTSPSLQVCDISGLQGARILGTPRQLKVEHSDLDSILVGPFIGTTDALNIQDTEVNYLDLQARSDDPIDILTLQTNLRPGNDMTLIPNWTFSGGTFTRNLTGLPGNQGLLWQIPGVKMYMVDASGIFKPNQNMGSPFTILNVYMDGLGNFSFDTTLTSIPARQTSHTATMTIASPTVITWTSHGLVAGTPVCFTTTGALPTGILNSTIYYVANDGNLATNTFSVSDTLAHANAGTNQINTSGSQSGTHTAYGNPLCFRIHPCPRFTSLGNMGSSTILDMNGANDEPLFSRAKRAFVGKQSTLSGSPAGFQVPQCKVWGFLRSMTVTVRKAGTSSGTLTITSPGFTQPALANGNFSQVIDTTTAGTRIVTNSTTTGSAGSDSLASYANWLAGPMLFTWSTGVTLANSPVVEFEITTDQGITRFSNMMGAPGTPSAGFMWQYQDSGISQQFGSTP